VGGESNPKYDVNSVDEISFAWVIDQLTRYKLLQINKRALKYPILDRLSMSLPPNTHHSSPPRNVQEAQERRIDWSDGQLVETNTQFWQIASQIATKRWEYLRKPGQYRAYDDRAGKEVEYEAFRESIHPSVWHRIQHRNYEPRCLPLSQWSRRRVSDGPGYEWVKASRSGYIQIRIPEYKIPDLPEGRDNGMEHWSGSLEQRIVPGEYLRRLDKGNGIIRGTCGSVPRPKSMRIDSGYDDSYDQNFLSPVLSRTESGYGKGRETVTMRTSTPQPSSGGLAADYYDVRRTYDDGR
jgi:hypothetical protein